MDTEFVNSTFLTFIGTVLIRLVLSDKKRTSHEINQMFLSIQENMLRT